MKAASRLIRVISWLTLILVIVGELFKIMHWPTASLQLMLASFLFTGIYLPLYSFEKWKLLETGKDKFILILQNTVLVLMAFGFIFRIQHWPGAAILSYVNYSLLLVLVIPFTFYHLHISGRASLARLHSILLVVYFLTLSLGSLSGFGNGGKVDIDTVLIQGLNTEKALVAASNRNQQLYRAVFNTEIQNEVLLVERIARLRQLTDGAINHVRKVKSHLVSIIDKQTPAKADSATIVDLINTNNIDQTTEILIGDVLKMRKDEFSALKLKEVIQTYRDSILQLVDSENKPIINEGINLQTSAYEIFGDELISWEYANFYEMPLISVHSTLTNLEYEMRNAEYQVLSDILNSKDNKLNASLFNQVADLNAKFDASKKQEQIQRLESENQKRILMLNDRELEISNSKDVIIVFALATLVFIILVFFIIRSNFLRKAVNKELRIQKDVIEKQKELVEQKNNEILDSIEYAKRIQNTILPPQKIVTQYLENSFILYLPKDIVAGDFYWMSAPSMTSIDDKNGSILFAACDCTGHGVPGAMVSVVCSNALNKAVNEFELLQPSQILDKVAELVVEDLSKNNDEGDEIKDGMDTSLAKLNASTLQLEWAGANNPLWIVRGHEIIEIKANKQPIGKTDFLEPFTNHEIQLQKGDTIYLFTDGYADQFGGEKGKKLSKNRFRELLISIQNKTMKEQREALYESHMAWRGTNEQVDDICVVGVRV